METNKAVQELERRRGARGASMNEFGRSLGLGGGMYSRLIRGKHRPSLATAARIQLLTGVPLNAWSEAVDP